MLVESVDLATFTGADEVVVVAVDVMAALADSSTCVTQQRSGFGDFCFGGEFEAQGKCPPGEVGGVFESGVWVVFVEC